MCDIFLSERCLPSLRLKLLDVLPEMCASERTTFQLRGRAIIAAVCITSFPQKYTRAQACLPTKKKLPTETMGN